jgi:peptidylprolyl isomerase
MNTANVKAVLAAIVTCAVVVVGLSMWSTKDSAPTTSTPKDDAITDLPSPLSNKALEAYQATMTNENNPVAEFITSKGAFSLELYEDTMPITAGNFIKLAEEGYYDGILFHRVIPGFMIQGGDPITKTADVARYGTGGPGYVIPDEHVAGEHLSNVRGSISMANSGPNSGGSQFFINVADNTPLDFDKEPLSSKHPVFGQVISGMEVVDAISLVATNQRDLPEDPVVIEKVTIKRK